MNEVAEAVSALAALAFLGILLWTLLGGHPVAVPDFAAYSPNAGGREAPVASLEGRRIDSQEEAEALFGALVQVRADPVTWGRADQAGLLVCPDQGGACGDSGEAFRFDLCEVHEQDGRQWDLIFAPPPCRVPTGSNPLKFVYRRTGPWSDAGLVWGPILPDQQGDLAVDVIADVTEHNPIAGAEEPYERASEEGLAWATRTGVRVSRDSREDHPRIEAGVPGLVYKRLTPAGWVLVILGTAGLILYGIGRTPLRTQWRLAVVTAKLAWPFRAGNGTAAIVVVASIVASALAPSHAGGAFYATAAQVIALLLLTLGVERRSFGLGDLKPPRGGGSDDELARLEIMAEEGLAWRPVLSVIAILMLVAGLLVSLVALAGDHPQTADSRIVFGAVVGGTTAIALLAIRSPRSD